MTFDERQQSEHRKAFIHECRQKAWGAACHANWISKSLDELMAHYQKLQEEEQTLDADHKAAETAVDYHTVESRDKRKAMQTRLNQIRGEEKPAIAKSAQDGQKDMQQLLRTVESNLQLAAHAEKWERKEAEAKDENLVPAE